MSEQRRGVVMILATSLAWGIMPLYWPLLRPAGAVEILAHRVVWSVVFFGALVIGLGRASALRALGGRRLRLLAVTALLVGVNWAIYIYGVNTGHVVETALGYFINPVVTVLLGVVVLGESLTRARWIAVGLIGIAIAVLTIDYGRLPWISLGLASSFATYGLLKKRIGVGAIDGLAVETSILTIPALAYLYSLEARGVGTFGHVALRTSVLLALTGPVTGLPLLSFAGAANRIPLRTLGLLQYVSPSLQFLLGVFAFREPMPTSRWCGFLLVWIALGLFVIDGLRAPRHASAGSTPASVTDP